MVNCYNEALKKLWVGLCDIYVLDSETDEKSGRTVQKDKMILHNEACRISYSNISTVDTNNEAAKISQTIKLFISNKVDIPAGAKIVVTQNGLTETYQRSGKPAVYSTHQEIMLELFRRWA